MIFNIFIIMLVIVTLYSPSLYNVWPGHITTEFLLPIFLILLFKKKRLFWGDIRIVLLLLFMGLINYLSILLNDGFIFGGNIQKGNLFTIHTYMLPIALLITTYNLSNKDSLKYYFISLSISLFGIGIIGILQFFNLFGIPELITQYYSTPTHYFTTQQIVDVRFRVSSIVDSNPFYYGALMSWLIFITLVSIVEIKKLSYKLLLLFTLFIEIYAFFLSVSKTATAALLILTLGYIFWKLKMSKKILFSICTFLLIILAINFINLKELEKHTQYGHVIRGYKLFFTTFSSNIFELESLSMRIIFWKRYLEEFNPINIFYGIGNTLYGKISEEEIAPDDEYIYYLVKTGLLGLIAFILIKLIIFFRLFNNIKNIKFDTIGRIFLNSFLIYNIFLFIIGVTGTPSQYARISFLYWMGVGVCFKYIKLIIGSPKQVYGVNPNG